MSVLDQLGYRASLRVVSTRNAYLGALGDSRDGVQAGFFSWYQDYPAPSDFIDPLFTCGSFVPDNRDNLNAAEFCDPRIDAQARQALALEQRRSRRGRGCAGPRIDRELVGPGTVGLRSTTRAT